MVCNLFDLGFFVCMVWDSYFCGELIFLLLVSFGLFGVCVGVMDSYIRIGSLLMWSKNESRVILGIRVDCSGLYIFRISYVWGSNFCGCS